MVNQLQNLHIYVTFDPDLLPMQWRERGNKLNKQDFLQLFQGSGIEKIEDNLKSAD